MVAHINAWSEAIRTLTATVDLEPAAGSAHSGLVKQYHDVRGFILFEKPSMIRMVGQAPVVRTQIFDMASDGKEFRLYLPTKKRFIVGNTGTRRRAKNSLENLRPQHITDALLAPPIDQTRERLSQSTVAEDGHWRYVLEVSDRTTEGQWTLRRKLWLDPANFEIARLQIYESQGSSREDVRYSDYQDFEGVRYPKRIQIDRSFEHYRLAINILKATFNQPIAPEKFELKKPERARLVDLRAAPAAEDSHGQ